LEQPEYESLLAFRMALRRLLHWSREREAAAGLTPAQHELLLVLQVYPDSAGPTISQLADYLSIRPHSAVQLADRVQALGLVRRHRDDIDRRLVRLQLTPAGRRRVQDLDPIHSEELRKLASLAAVTTTAQRRRAKAASRSGQRS
jgi:DNA-binding MarR family transcriptional regulator